MHTIALVCQKGGAGKTTMAIHLAVEGQRRGLKTLLIDIDPQASAAKIMDRRGDQPPDVATEAAARLERAIKAAAGQGYELVIVDTAPQADRAAAQAAKIADLVVAPLQPSCLLRSSKPTSRIGDMSATSGRTHRVNRHHKRNYLRLVI
jgi:chromosome partitioning protein